MHESPNSRAIIPLTPMRRFAVLFGALCSLSTLSLGLTESLLAAAPDAILAVTNLLVGAFARERVARIFVLIELAVIVVALGYAGYIMLRSSS